MLYNSYIKRQKSNFLILLIQLLKKETAQPAVIQCVYLFIFSLYSSWNSDAAR